MGNAWREVYGGFLCAFFGKGSSSYHERCSSAEANFYWGKKGWKRNSGFGMSPPVNGGFNE